MRIQQQILDEIAQHLRTELPREGWGILAGSAGVVQQVFRMSNLAASPVEYESDAGELNRVLNLLQEEGVQMLCIYHSHPPVGAYFSETDLRRAWVDVWESPAYPGAVYLVVGFKGTDTPKEWKAYRVEAGRAIEEPLEVMEGS